MNEGSRKCTVSKFCDFGGWSLERCAVDLDHLEVETTFDWFILSLKRK